jgi:hypothetical protein
MRALSYLALLTKCLHSLLCIAYPPSLTSLCLLQARASRVPPTATVYVASAVPEEIRSYLPMASCTALPSAAAPITKRLCSTMVLVLVLVLVLPLVLVVLLLLPLGLVVLLVLVLLLLGCLRRTKRTVRATRAREARRTAQPTSAWTLAERWL